MYGGEGGIRTLDTFRYTRFPGERLQPLGHLTVNLSIVLSNYLYRFGEGRSHACALPPIRALPSAQPLGHLAVNSSIVLSNYLHHVGERRSHACALPPIRALPSAQPLGHLTVNGPPAGSPLCEGRLMYTSGRVNATSIGGPRGKVLCQIDVFGFWGRAGRSSEVQIADYFLIIR